MTSSFSALNDQILSDLRSVSSGTLANLTGVSDYRSIERVHSALMTLAINVMSKTPSEFTHWMDVWNRLLYVEASNILLRAAGSARVLRLPALNLAEVPASVRREAAFSLLSFERGDWTAVLECLRLGRAPAKHTMEHCCMPAYEDEDGPQIQAELLSRFPELASDNELRGSEAVDRLSSWLEELASGPNCPLNPAGRVVSRNETS